MAGTHVLGLRRIADHDSCLSSLSAPSLAVVASSFGLEVRVRARVRAMEPPLRLKTLNCRILIYLER
jgi:hypothetical protein